MTTPLFTIVASLLVANVSAQNNWVYKCNLCYSEERDIGLPNHVVDTGGGSYTCQEMKNFATNGEFGPQSCAIAQVWAAKECGCTGPPITPPPIISASSCSLCPFPDMIFGLPNKLVMVDGIGEWPCQDLFDGGAQGYFTRAQCKTMQATVSEACGCRNQVPSPAPSSFLELKSITAAPTPAPTSAPSVDSGFIEIIDSAPVSAPQQCASPGDACFNANDCCSNRCVSVSSTEKKCFSAQVSNSKAATQKLGGCRGGSGGNC